MGRYIRVIKKEINTQIIMDERITFEDEYVELQKQHYLLAVKYEKWDLAIALLNNTDWGRNPAKLVNECLTLTPVRLLLNLHLKVKDDTIRVLIENHIMQLI
jgi:hypothetical protein